LKVRPNLRIYPHISHVSFNEELKAKTRKVWVFGHAKYPLMRN